VPPKDITGFLLSLQGVHNGWQVDSLLSFLQTIGASELISTPTVTVLNGHRAVINTGSKVPVFSATGLGSNAQVTTTFQDTGVKVEMIPFIVSDDVIRIDLSVDVSAVTGEVPFVLSGVEVETPVISTRTRHDGARRGQVRGGRLRGRGTIETITKVPVLGDIPPWAGSSRAAPAACGTRRSCSSSTPTIRIPMRREAPPAREGRARRGRLMAA
jgi:type II secretory pathway component GspD/PulD (secretin)